MKRFQLSRFAQFVGIDAVRARFAALAAIAAWIAVLVATQLDLPNAHWAGVTVFTVAQPSRGLLIERCIWRLTGTAVGAIVGGVLLFTLSDHPVYLVAALALWLSACAATTSLVRHLKRYGVLLAGFTAAIVALIDVHHPGNVEFVAWGRVSCTVIGILAATVVSALFVPASPRKKILAAIQALASSMLTNIRGDLAHVGTSNRNDWITPLVLEMANAEASLDEIFDGSPGATWRKGRARNLLGSLMETARCWSAFQHQLNRIESDAETQETLRTVALLLEQAELSLSNAASLGCGPLRGMGKCTEGQAFQKSLAGLVEDFRALSWKSGLEQIQPRLVTEPDFPVAILAAVRTGLAVLSVGAAWVISGWQDGYLMLLGASIFITAFSLDEAGRFKVLRVIPGIALGILAAYALRHWLHPAPQNVSELLLGLLPFLVLSGIGLSMRLTAISAVEYNNFFLMLGQPSHLTPYGPPILTQGFALLTGVVLAVVVLNFLLPLNRFRRQALHARTIRSSLQLLATKRNLGSDETWRSRAHFRTLRWVARPANDDASLRIAEAMLATDLGMLIRDLRSHSIYSNSKCRPAMDAAIEAMTSPSVSAESVAKKMMKAATSLGALPEVPPAFSFRLESYAKRMEGLHTFLSPVRESESR